MNENLFKTKRVDLPSRCVQRTLVRAKGAIFVIVVLLLPVLLGFTALVLDLGLEYNAKNSLHAVTDDAALAGAVQLQLNNLSGINTAVSGILSATPILGQQTASLTAVQLGVWDDSAQQFTVNNNNPTAVQVTSTFSGQGYFLNLFGITGYGLTRTSTATLLDHRPLQVVLVVDLSSNMSQASQLAGMGKGNTALTSSDILTRLNAIYNALNPLPSYGSLTATNQAAVSGSSATAISAQFGLSSLTYPYANGGTWSDYVLYIESCSGADASFLHQYGYPSLMNYWQEKQFSYQQTPILWQTPEQPLQAVKNAVSFFQGKLKTNVDQVALVTIGPSATLETPLAYTLSAPSAVLNGSNGNPGRQAGHYGLPDGSIAAGLSLAANQFNLNSTANFKFVVVLIASGASDWSNVDSTIASLQLQNIQVYELMIGQGSTAATASTVLNASLVANSQAFNLDFAGTDYSTSMQTIITSLQNSQPRLAN